MSLHLCLDCATIWEVPEGVPRICRTCGQPLVITRDDDRFDHAEPLSVIASWALFGLPDKERNGLL